MLRHIESVEKTVLLSNPALENENSMAARESGNSRSRKQRSISSQVPSAHRLGRRNHILIRTPSER
jgi:hypothetical protein